MKNRVFSLIIVLAIIISFFTIDAVSSYAYNDVVISTYGNYETAGVNIKVPGLTKSTKGTLKYKKTSESVWKDGHDFVKYDGNHMATSLFDLELDTEYIVEVFLDGASHGTNTFRTKKEFAVPTYTTVVNVSNASGLTTALSNATSNSMIVLVAGTYNGTFTISNKTNVVIKSASDNTRPLITGKFTFASGCKNIYFDGIEVTKSSSVRADVVQLTNAEDISISNCYIHDAGGNYDYEGNINILSDLPRAGHTIINNIICDENDSTRTYFGIKIGESDTKVNNAYITIRDNYIYNLDDGIHTGSDEKRNPVLSEDDNDYLTVRNGSQEIDFYNNVMFNFRDDCIETDGHMVNGRYFKNRLGTTVNSITVASTYPGPNFFVRNVISGFSQGCLKQNTGKGSNTIAEVTRNCYFYNNTVLQTKEGVPCLLRGEPGFSDKMTYMNNIFYSIRRIYDTNIYSTNVKHSNQFFDYNLLYRTGVGTSDSTYVKVPTKDGTGVVSYNTWQQYLSGGLGDQNSVFQEEPKINLTDWYYSDLPEFIKAKYPTASVLGMIKGDIPSNSPAIDRGTVIKGITNNISGSAPDIGAFEYSSSAAIPTSTPTPTVTVAPTGTPTPTTLPTSTPTPTIPVVSSTPTPTIPVIPTTTVTPMPTGIPTPTIVVTSTPTPTVVVISIPTPTPTPTISNSIVKKPTKVIGVKDNSKKENVAVLTWKKSKNTKGYEVFRLSKNGKYRRVRTINGASNLKYAKKRLKSNKVYSFKIRAFNLDGSKKIYGAFSAAKKVKIK